MKCRGVETSGSTARSDVREDFAPLRRFVTEFHNDKIFATIDSYFSGYMSKEMALEKLKFEKPNHQICILNQEALNMHLHFKEAIKLN